MTATYSPPEDLFTTAVLALLNANPDNRKVWDGVYGGDPTNPLYPYGILYAIPGGDADPMPDLDGDTREITLGYQVSAVSNLRNQCQATARLLRDQLVARTTAGAWLHDLVLPDGWQCIDRRPDPTPPGVVREGQPPTAIFTSPGRFWLTFTPTA